MTEPEHSPLPWRDNGFEIRDAMGETAPIYGLDHKEVANRRLIIKAVTSHDALLAAAKEMLSAIATRDIGSFTWESRAAKALKAAIAVAEESTP